ncbi:hypothetical protein EV356DRAFT_497242 [Viridothelium virens]|uniref:Uncharacterized protein n=1 Tax=Viridothelium virens TaxID=1048519 RepID=A0A6A6HHG0_VIRVR|nr:hypothetical protein EV356DRAFT_497242 [Viridothelium virens]
MKTYNMYYTASRTNVTLHLGSSSTPSSYYAGTALMTASPSVRLHSGDQSGPVLSIAKFRWTSRHSHLALGDPDKEPETGDQTVWEKMTREKNVLRRSDYTFATSAGSDLGKRREFRWSKDTGKLMSNVYNCLDQEGQVVASMLSGGFFNWKKGGEIEIDDGLSKELQELLIVSALGIWCAEACSAMTKGYGGGHERSD